MTSAVEAVNIPMMGFSSSIYVIRPWFSGRRLSLGSRMIDPSAPPAPPPEIVKVAASV
jgi:hypothetical protein